jgi:hypothetical protein
MPHHPVSIPISRLHDNAHTSELGQIDAAQKLQQLQLLSGLNPGGHAHGREISWQNKPFDQNCRASTCSQYNL